MITWHVVRNTEITIVVILADIELSRLNIFNGHSHFAATTLSQANFFWVCCITCLLHCKTKAWRVENELMVTPCSFVCASCSRSRLEKSVLLTISTELTKNEMMPLALASAKSNNYFGVRIWFEKGYWRLVCAASLLGVPPTPSQEFFPCDTAKNSIQRWCWSCFDGIQD